MTLPLAKASDKSLLSFLPEHLLLLQHSAEKKSLSSRNVVTASVQRGVSPVYLGAGESSAPSGAESSPRACPSFP